MRSMVEGAVRATQRFRMPTPPSTIRCADGPPPREAGRSL